MIDALLANFGDILPFILIGFGAQMIDGALGMAYGVISSTLLLAMGVPPSRASASVHAAETFTTGVSAISHILHGNVDWRLFAVRGFRWVRRHHRRKHGEHMITR